ncbi:hypothetical protein ACFE35_05630 [Phormidesmis priestleyi ANT.L61.2]
MFAASIAGSALIALNPLAAQSAILTSATLGATGQIFGVPVSNVQYLGWRFKVTAPFQVTQIGGHLVGDGGGKPVFGAIVRLSSPTAFPTAFPPAPGEVVASATFIPPSALTTKSQDVRIPLSASLPPGNYALIFGSTTRLGGIARLPINNSSLPGSTYFLSGGGTYQNLDPSTGLTNIRFVVEGN